VVLHGDLGVQLTEAHLAPRTPVGLEVAQDDVLVVAEALRVVIGPALAGIREVRPEAAGSEGLDRLQEEEEGDRGVDEEIEAEKRPQPLRQVVTISARVKEEEAMLSAP
jgi:hypothetical protein